MSESSLPSKDEARWSRRTIIVNTSGGGDYTQIQPAIYYSNHGDTVYIEAGIYHENVIVDKRINLIGAGSDNTTIEGVDDLFFDDVLEVNSEGVHIKDLHINHSSTYYTGIHIIDSPEFYH